MEIVSIPLPAGQPLANAYVNRTDERLVQVFGNHPDEASDWQRRAEHLINTADQRVRPAELASVLRQYNSQFHQYAEVSAHINLIADGAPVIVGGQQAGLWTGPLLVIHKAITILQAAKEAEAKLGRPVVPVFWIAGEDHDWDEANHALLPDQHRKMMKIAIERPGAVRTSVSRTPLTMEAWQGAIRELAGVLEDSAFKAALLERLTSIAERSETLTASFAHLMSDLFGQYGLVLLDADDPAIRRLEQPFFRRLIERNDELEAALLQGAARVRELGYKEQADVASGAANLFIFHAEDNGPAGERTLLYKRDGKFVNRKETVAFSKEELLARLEHFPASFSNNVLSRPLMQDYALPVLGAVLGQGEIAYWALTAEAFRCFNMQMPIIVPRMSFTLVEPAAAKYMESFKLTFEEVAHRFEAFKAEWLQEKDEWAIGERFAAVKQQFADLYEPILQMAGEIEAGLAPLGETNKRKIAEQIDFMEKRIKEAHARRFDTMLQRLDRIAISLWPDEMPQERVWNPLYFMNRYGNDWLAALMAVPYEQSGGHRLVYL